MAQRHVRNPTMNLRVRCQRLLGSGSNEFEPPDAHYSLYNAEPTRLDTRPPELDAKQQNGSRCVCHEFPLALLGLTNGASAARAQDWAVAGLSRPLNLYSRCKRCQSPVLASARACGDPARWQQFRVHFQVLT